MNPSSRYPTPSLDTLPDDVRARIEEVAGKSGFVPNVFLVLAHRPAEFRAFFAYHDAVMSQESALTAAEKEMIVVATSAANDCTYCVVAHGAILRIRARDPHIADQIATHFASSPLTDRRKVMLAFAVKLARTPEAIDDEDHQRLAEAGFSSEDVWDIGAITGLFALSNRMAHLTGMAPNEEFYLMGRQPRE